jgi:hypothetical protein
MTGMGQTGEATTTVPSVQYLAALGPVPQGRQDEEVSRPYST